LHCAQRTSPLLAAVRVRNPNARVAIPSLL
jgi:hypothetical protein